MITGIAHINLTVPPGALDEAEAFYSGVLGMTRVPVPRAFEGRLAWFDITPGGQQVHIAFGPAQEKSSRHPCFRVENGPALLRLRQRVWDCYVDVKTVGRPLEAAEPEGDDGGSKAVEFPERFFCRDFAGNRLEFSL